MSYREFKHNLAELFFCGCSYISPYLNTRLRYFQVFGKRMDLEHPVIINLSETENLVTVMTCNEIFNPNHPDTFFEPV